MLVLGALEDVAHLFKRRRHIVNELLTEIIEAHGGMDRWNGYKKIDAAIVSGGVFSHSKEPFRTPNRDV